MYWIAFITMGISVGIITICLFINSERISREEENRGNR